MTTLNSQLKPRSLLFTALGISLGIHLCGVFYFYTHPFLIHESWKSPFNLSSAKPEYLEFEEENEELAAKNRVIEEAFQQLYVTSSHLQQPLDLIEMPQGIALSPTAEEDLPSIKSDFFAPGTDEDLSSEKIAQAEMPALSEDSSLEPLFLPKESSFDIASQLNFEDTLKLSDISSFNFPRDLSSDEVLIDRHAVSLSDVSIEASFETDRHGVNILDHLPPLAFQEKADLPPLKIDPHGLLGKIDPSALATEGQPSAPFVLPPKESASDFVTLGTKRAAITVTLPNFEEYNFPPLATAAQWNNDFDVQLQFWPKEEGEGYIFSLSFSPNFDAAQYSLKQNFYFILDRSNSVQKHRFAVFKRAVVKALASLRTGDSFNIFVVDKKIERFKAAPVPHSLKNIQAAEDFLDKQEAGGLFAASDIYSSLDKLLPEITDDGEINTAVLLTDGHTLLDTSKQQKVFSKWIDKNSGKLSVYTAAVGQKNNLVMLDFLSSVSGGKLLYSDTHASFPRKLAKLMLDLRDPVAKDLMITAIPQNPHSTIELLPGSSHLPSIYSHQPYVIVGSIDEPCNFDVVIQGKHGEEWISIQKTISFVEGEKANRVLTKEWNAKQANHCYAKFLKEGKASHLKDAKEILKSSRTEIAFD